MDLSQYVQAQCKEYQKSQMEWGLWWTGGALAAIAASMIAPLAVVPLVGAAGLGATKYVSNRSKLQAFEEANRLLQQGDVTGAEKELYSVEKSIWWRSKQEGTSEEFEQKRIAFNLANAKFDGSAWGAMATLLATVGAALAAGPAGGFAAGTYLLYRGYRAKVDSAAFGEAEKQFKSIEREEEQKLNNDNLTLVSASETKRSMLPDLDTVTVEPKATHSVERTTQGPGLNWKRDVAGEPPSAPKP